MISTKFHELIALSLGIVDREILLGLAVGGAEDVGRPVDSALELALVAAFVRVRVLWVNARGVALDAVCFICAIASIQCLLQKD